MIAKVAILATTKHVAIGYGNRNTKVCTRALGNIATAASYYSITKQGEITAATEPVLKQRESPEGVAKAAVCLASESSWFATANTIIIDGGKVNI